MLEQPSISARVQDKAEVDHLHREVINQSNRLLCGSAYRRGLLSGLGLLRRLRSDPYKSKSPEANLDLDQIATHANQAVIYTLLFSLWALGAALLQLLLDFTARISFSSFLSFLASMAGFAGALIISYELVYLRWANARRFLKYSYDPNFRIEFLKPLVNFFKERILQPDPSQNIITFGGYKPFLGSGGRISGWTLAIDRKPTGAGDDINVERIAVPLHEFYRAADEAVSSLNLKNLQISTLLFVNGEELDVDHEILSKSESRPTTHLNEAQIWEFGQRDLSSCQRAYRMYRYLDVARDMMLSYYLRCYNIGSITFIEGTAYTLTSIDRQQFSLIPVLKNNKITRLIKTFLLAIPLSFFYMYAFVAIFHIVVFLFNLVSWWSYDRRQRRAARSHEEYNHGLVLTFRESVAASFYQDYYGVQDLTMYWKAIEEAIIFGMEKMLKQHGVDTSKFEQQATTIINSGVMVAGGQFTANQMAVGTGATSIMSSTGASVAANTFQHIAQAVASRVTAAKPDTKS
jgi:hypothetical protein